MVHKATQIDCTGSRCLTQQSAKDECDINIIVERAKRGADLSQLTREPIYGDFTGLPSYRDALVMVTKARELFMSMDALVRERFGNDPGRMLDFLADSKNREEAIRLGLVKPPVVASVAPSEAKDGAVDGLGPKATNAASK